MVAVSSVHYPDDGNASCAAVEDASWWFQHRNRVLLDLMRRYPPRPPLHDVGGGNGVVAAALASVGIPAIVVEPGEAGVRRARERGLEARPATLQSAGFAPRSLGSIGMFDVVEHIEDDVGFLRGTAGFLEPGGRLYLTAPACPILWSAEDVHAGHFRRYTTGRMRRALEAAGFEVEHLSYMFALLPLPVLLFRTIPFRLGRPRPFSAAGVESDHTTARGVRRLVLSALLGLERWGARLLGGLPFGGTVVAVARAR